MTSWIKSKFGIQRFPQSGTNYLSVNPISYSVLAFLPVNLDSCGSPSTCNILSSHLFLPPIFKTWFKCRAFCTPTPCLLPLLCAPMERQRGQWSEISTPSPVLCCGHLHPFRSPTENIKRGKTRQRSIPCDCPRLWLWPRSWCALSKLGVILSSLVLNLRDSFCLRQWFSRLFQKPLISKRILQWSNI